MPEFQSSALLSQNSWDTFFFSHLLFTHRNDREIQQIPDPPKVLEPVLPDLNDLLDDVVDDEGAVDELARHDKVVLGIDVAKELDGVEVQLGQHTTGRGKFKEDPGGYLLVSIFVNLSRLHIPLFLFKDEYKENLQRSHFFGLAW